MEKLSDLIGKRLHQHKLGEVSKAASVLHSADALLYKKFQTDATQLKALHLKNGTLTIGTASSVWSQELWGYQETLLKQLNHMHGEKSVVKIRLQSQLV